MARATGDINKQIQSPRLLNLVLGFGILTTLIAIGLYGYLGTFSRYGSDDYCLSAFFHQSGSFLGLMIHRYMTASSRYTNILFIGLADKLLGWYNVAILPPLMLALFVLGMYLFLQQVVRLASLGWNRLLILLLAALVVYFSVMQAPDLYETLYWRAGMTSHFAPLVFLSFLGAFLVREIRLARERTPSVWAVLACFLSALLIGGFSEPPLTMLITILVLSIMVVWFRDRSPARRSRVTLLFSTLAGAILALLILALAPANSLRLGTPPPGIVELGLKSFGYPFEFIVDVFRSLPLPTLMTFLLPAFITFAYYSRRDPALPAFEFKWIALTIVLVSLVAYLLIAASFAPSVYGQSYPVPRARFAGRVILTCALMANGALIGILAANIKVKRPSSAFLYSIAILGLAVLALYPLRTASRLAAEIPVYQQRALAWDARDANIRSLQAQGQRELVVPFLGEEIIQDLGDRTEFRLNRCAATLYNVTSIRAVPKNGN
jgi:hypothetical protein